MSELARDFYANGGLTAAPLFAMLFFFVVFGVAIVRALFIDKRHLERLSRLPLEEGESHE